ncbi:hypothetical protein DENIS_2677 [Desulfonema ishimotonii]|uniref:Uncharacterized protein n=1 Tax=Desulfonema ishimotonii TaxID=45657 RepID=A0A401FXM7_9BACT|nr:hypothetical protein [Desulfonema ishimotonii]GBC61715.1 hypothetical protein DENIS_2677 [Desulfonema ishimotonii]
MKNDLHTFHIPVMGTGHSADTPIRVAPFGISSVISVVDDLLLEKFREYHSRKFDLPYTPIPRNETDGRARRITAYLETVREIVRIRLDRIRALPFFEENDKKKYFDMLPDSSPLRKDHEKLLGMEPGPERDALVRSLTDRMTSGSIDVNIMVKLDTVRYDRDGNPLGDEFSDAKAALRGYAESGLESAIVFSAGINKGLFSYMTRFRDFYRDTTGRIKKKIILKVSDFRSAMIQGRFLAKKGLEIHEYRIESGLNCGGHAFPTNGHLLPCLIQEFKEKRDQLATGFHRDIRKYYADREWTYTEPADGYRPLVTVQGGIGTNGEVRRLTEDFGMDMTGWASPFLLVPEATPIDTPTRTLLAQAGEKDLYLSGASPFGIPFNNVRRSGSEQWTRQKADAGNPGSACPKKFLVFNREFTDKPICLASRQYQQKKLAEIRSMDIPGPEKEQRCREVTEKVCLCEHLGNGSLIVMGMAEAEKAPQSICPGPNIEWFDRNYTLKEMVDHIYGRGPALVAARRPHMFAKELVMYVDYFEKQVKQYSGTEKEVKAIQAFKDNLRQGMAFCLEIAEKTPYPGENLTSLRTCVERENSRLKSVYTGFKRRLKLRDMFENGLTPPAKLSSSAV